MNDKINYINRQVALIKPKEPYIRWINSLPGNVNPVSISSLQTDCTAILIPNFDTYDESMNYIKKIFRPIFEYELYGWYTDKNTWPKRR